MLCTKVGVELVPEKAFPWPQLSIVKVPPGRTTAPPTTPTAVGTFVSWMLFKTSDPASEVDGCEFRTKIGVLITTASMIASAPTV